MPDGRNGRFGRGEDMRETQRKNISPDESGDNTNLLEDNPEERAAIQEFDGEAS